MISKYPYALVILIGYGHYVSYAIDGAGYDQYLKGYNYGLQYGSPSYIVNTNLDDSQYNFGYLQGRKRNSLINLLKGKHI